MLHEKQPQGAYKKRIYNESAGGPKIPLSPPFSKGAVTIDYSPHYERGVRGGFPLGLFYAEA
jgi:hypothetical protein